MTVMDGAMFGMLILALIVTARWLRLPDDDDDDHQSGLR